MPKQTYPPRIMYIESMKFEWTATRLTQET
jgi:hypothetical protein